MFADFSIIRHRAQKFVQLQNLHNLYVAEEKHSELSDNDLTVWLQQTPECGFKPKIKRVSDLATDDQAKRVIYLDFLYSYIMFTMMPQLNDRKEQLIQIAKGAKAEQMQIEGRLAAQEVVNHGGAKPKRGPGRPRKQA